MTAKQIMWDSTQETQEIEIRQKLASSFTHTPHIAIKGCLVYWQRSLLQQAIEYTSKFNGMTNIRFCSETKTGILLFRCLLIQWQSVSSLWPFCQNSQVVAKKIYQSQNVFARALIRHHSSSSSPSIRPLHTTQPQGSLSGRPVINKDSVSQRGWYHAAGSLAPLEKHPEENLCHVWFVLVEIKSRYHVGSKVIYLQNPRKTHHVDSHQGVSCSGLVRTTQELTYSEPDYETPLCLFCPTHVPMTTKPQRMYFANYKATS